jgi:transcriptional regulator with PAS, ATPase and Fis domain
MKQQIAPLADKRSALLGAAGLKQALGGLIDCFAQLCDGVVIVDHDARIVWMNEHYPKKLGLTDPDAVIGQAIETVIPNSRMREVVTTGKPIMLDIMDFGSQSFVVMRLPLRDEAQAVIGGVGVVVFDSVSRLSPLMARVERLKQDLADAQRRLAHERRAKYTFASFLGTSAVCQRLKNEARRAARTLSPVLILGETGTGKELLAQAIHAASAQAGGPFVAVNLAAIPENLLEAEFFGVAPGAYTGADRRGRVGKFKLADGGTLFLDEIGDMPAVLQAKLLRVLQEHEFEPVGSNHLTPVRVRIIAATHRRLDQEVGAGRFRSDLFYRLHVLSLQVPPLRERLDDLPLLCEHLIEHIARQAVQEGSMAIQAKGLTPAALQLLARYHWPGNVRELANVLERAMMASESEMLDADDLAPLMTLDAPSLPMTPPIAPAAAPAEQQLAQVCGLKAVRLHRERQAISEMIAACGGNRSEAARRLGISRATLYQKLAHA